MTSQLIVSNLALAHLATGKLIASINEQTQSARVMKQFYPQVRDEVFRDFNWPFARKFATLTRVAVNPTPDWAFSYRYPDDCLFVRDLPSANAVAFPDDLATSPWRNLGGAAIATNAVAEYAGRNFSRISNAANNPGAYGQGLALSVDGPYRSRVMVKKDAAVTGTFIYRFYDATSGLYPLDVTFTISASDQITAIATSGTVVALRSPETGVWSFELSCTGVVAGHTNYILVSNPNGTASSYLLSDVECVPGTPSSRFPYIVGQDDSGRLIYTNTATAQIEYTIAVDEEFWPPDFTSAVSLLLAAYAAPVLTAGDPHKLGERARAAYQDAIVRAQLAGENEQEGDLPVANLALLHLGVGRPEMPPDEAKRAMRAVRQLFAQVRDEVFRERHWPFARKFVSLTNVAGPTPRASTDFAYSYRYPSDCVAARYLRNGPRRPFANTRFPSAFDPTQFPLAPEARVPFIVGQNAGGRLILTDAEPVAATSEFAAFPELEYTALVDQPAWPPDFTGAVAARLAWQAAPMVVKGDARGLRERLRIEYEQSIARAWSTHLQEQEADPEPDSAFISARN